RLSATMSERPHPENAEKPIGGSVLAGFLKTLSSAQLLNAAPFPLLYAATSTFLSFDQSTVVAKRFTPPRAATPILPSLDLTVNVLTLAIQLSVTGRIVRWLGVGLALALLPALSVLGFGVLALLPTLGAVVVFQVIRRAGNFALTRPTREVLFTVVPREDR